MSSSSGTGTDVGVDTSSSVGHGADGLFILYLICYSGMLVYSWLVARKHSSKPGFLVVVRPAVTVALPCTDRGSTCCFHGRCCPQPCLCGVLLYENFCLSVEAYQGSTAFVVAIDRGRFTVDGTSPCVAGVRDAGVAVTGL